MSILDERMDCVCIYLNNFNNRMSDSSSNNVGDSVQEYLVKSFNDMAAIGTRVACYCPLTLPESRWNVTEYTMTCQCKEFRFFDFHGPWKEKETVYCYKRVNETFIPKR